MDISIRSDVGANRLVIEITGVDWEACKREDLYQGELTVQELVASMGRELTRESMTSKEETALRIEHKGTVYYKKQEPCREQYKSLYGDIEVERHLYQTAQGGTTICPMELSCQMAFGRATPRLAQVLAWKVSAMTPREAAADLDKCHGVELAPSYILETAQRVGQMAVEKKEPWELWATGTDQRPVRVLATGMDGTTMPLPGRKLQTGDGGHDRLLDGGRAAPGDRVSGGDAGRRQGDLLPGL